MDTTFDSARRPWRRRWVVAVAAVLLAAPAGARAAAGGAVSHHLPDLKRSYDLLLPAGEAKGQGLVIFLHGSESPQADRFKADYWPIFRARKCPVALPKASGKRMWRYEDAKYIMAVIADVEKRYATDPKRRVLMGVSGGGQTALFLVDHAPEDFRAVIAVSTNPVVIRGRRHEWFYPTTRTAKTCPYLVINHITQGAAIQYWRQVRLRRQADGTSISILPVLGKVSHYQPPPTELVGWLDKVLAGKHPAAIPDPQKAAIAKMFARAAAELPKAIAAAKPDANAKAITGDGKLFRLSLLAPETFERSKRLDKTDAAGRPITQVRVEHKDWPITVRCDARRTDKPMAAVLKAEEDATIGRGMLYQVYHAARLKAGKRDWQIKIGSITYPDRRRGWVSGLFLDAAAPIARSAAEWLEVTVLDETHQPDAAELAGVLRTVLAGIHAEPAKAAPASKPAR